ncbi:hypothetical protein HF325_006831 [Metschnikowia pulcherrima]|uniref:Uncharacterized protein n=1 Tax=Metschnikowia pulcherrima TaxID=27326 RepID=A0A8H7L6S6_9ASCO|nr:hypothetical protein HF325_006831 [Metschnikowia pulcherrima]
MSFAKGFQNGDANLQPDELSFIPQNVKKIRSLFFRNRGVLHFKILKAGQEVLNEIFIVENELETTLFDLQKHLFYTTLDGRVPTLYDICTYLDVRRLNDDNQYPKWDSIVVDFLVVATHKLCCCILEKCLIDVTPVQHKVFADVILEHSNYSRLVNDQFSNYVLQDLIAVDSMDVNYRLYEHIGEYGLATSCVHRFSSNFTEKLLKSCYKN